jgi:hypothetical protein
VPDRGLGLDGDELGKLIYRVERLGGVLHLPDHHRGDLDRVAISVVHLGHRRLMVPDPDRYLPPPRERVDPVQAGRPDRAPVAAEQLHHPGLAHHHRRQAMQRQQGGDQQQDRHHNQERVGWTCGMSDAPDQQSDPRDQQHHTGRQDGDTRR